ALPDTATLTRMRELTTTVAESLIADGDHGGVARATAADELWRLRADADSAVPLDASTIRELFAAMGQQLRDLYDAERAAVDRLLGALS
ncbi:hypothetical protein, partial [Vibrio harveyi]|uniref:hypothetical protein n=1 Tax=Vibrio harveyi TaxID=669 RepID=UPI0033912852